MEAIKDDHLYKTDEALKIVNVSKPTILRHMKNGKLPFTGDGGRGGFRILGSDLKNYAKKYGYRNGYNVENEAAIEARIVKLELQKLEIVLSIAKAQYEITKSTEDYIAMKKAELAIVTYKLQLEKGRP